MEPSPDSAPPGVSRSFWSLLTAESLEDKMILDVGTGTGRLALALAPRARRVIGVDREPELIAEARRRASAAGLSNAEFVPFDAEAGDYDIFQPDLVVAHLCMSDMVVERAARALQPGQVLAFVAFHVDQWRETGRPSRFAYDESRMRHVLDRAAFAVESLEVEREVTTFGSVEAALAAAAALEEKWKIDGRWFRYVKFLEDGGHTLTRSHLVVKARRS